MNNMSTPSGGITFQRPENTDPATELEVLKCILLREGYLKRLREMGASAGSSGLRSEVVDLLDLLRIATVETVEMIEDWRKGQVGVRTPCRMQLLTLPPLLCALLRQRNIPLFGTGSITCSRFPLIWTFLTR